MWCREEWRKGSECVSSMVFAQSSLWTLSVPSSSAYAFDYGADCSLVFGAVRLGEMPSGGNDIYCWPWGVGDMPYVEGGPMGREGQLFIKNLCNRLASICLQGTRLKTANGQEVFLSVQINWHWSGTTGKRSVPFSHEFCLLGCQTASVGIGLVFLKTLASLSARLEKHQISVKRTL